MDQSCKLSGAPSSHKDRSSLLFLLQQLLQTTLSLLFSNTKFRKWKLTLNAQQTPVGRWGGSPVMWISSILPWKALILVERRYLWLPYRDRELRLMATVRAAFSLCSACFRAVASYHLETLSCGIVFIQAPYQQCEKREAGSRIRGEIEISWAAYAASHSIQRVFLDCSLAGAFPSGSAAACKKENLLKCVYHTSDHSIWHTVSTVTSTENIFQSLSALLLGDPFCAQWSYEKYIGKKEKKKWEGKFRMVWTKYAEYQ